MCIRDRISSTDTIDFCSTGHFQVGAKSSFFRGVISGKQSQIVFSTDSWGSGVCLYRPWGPGGPQGPIGPLGPFGAEMPPQGATWAPRAPYGAEMPPKGATWAPLGPYWLDLPPSPPGQLQRSSQGRFFPSRKRLFSFFGPKMVKEKLRLRGLDLSGEIRSGILCKTPPRMSKMVGWRPIW